MEAEGRGGERRRRDTYWAHRWLIMILLLCIVDFEIRDALEHWNSSIDIKPIVDFYDSFGLPFTKDSPIESSSILSVL